MALISPESLERVKQTADIVEVISAHTDLRRQGARWVGLCPFHEERTPSFSVDAQEKLYHCFGCGVGGDVIKFVEEKEGLGFAEAVELLADRYGVELEREQEDPRAEAQRQQRRRLEQLLERTAAYYASYLWDSEEAGKAREYLAERGLGEEALRAFGVGFAPSAWDKILVRGQQAGFSVEELRGVGLVQRGRSGGEYDRFRSRIMFPIRDRRGRTLGFGGRAMRSDQGAKYVNTAETDFFHKSQMLYGVDLAKAAIAKAARAVVVEGYTDVLALHQAGVEEAVGVMGTAITGEQVATLSGMVEEVVLALDADSAGQEAMLRAQRVAAGRKMRLRVAAMPAGVDPAEMMAEPGGAERFRALVDAAVELTDFQVGLVLDRTDVASPVERDRALERGGADAGRDGGVGEPRRPRAPGRRAPRPRAGDGDGQGGGGAADERRRAESAPAAAVASRRRAAAAARGRADLARAPRAGAAGDVHRPAGGGPGVPRAPERRPPLADRDARRRLAARAPGRPGLQPPRTTTRWRASSPNW